MDTTMKRNKPMRTAMVALILALVSMCAISGVLAKYVITDNATDTARVAKFGVVTSASGNLFGDSYVKAGETNGNEIQTAAYNVSNESATAYADNQTIVAPGTQNSTGLTFTVKGKPEVSTRLIVDAPEGDGTTGTDNADFANTDIYLKSGAYAVMAPVKVADVSITADNCGDYYTYADNKFTQLTTATYGSASGTVYRQIQLTGETSTTMSEDYFPIHYYVNDTTMTGNGINGASAIRSDAGTGLQSTLASALAGSGTGVDTTDGVTKATHVPNYTYTGEASNGKAQVTWKWNFGAAWAESDSELIHNWENTTLSDLEDTVLGQMIALAKVPDTTADYKVAVKNGDDWNEVLYTEVTAKDGSANKVWLAYDAKATAPTDSTGWDASSNLACLTATYGARVTVEQVD